MLLAVDIGNSAIKFGLFDDGTLTSKFSIPTKRDATADEIKLTVGDRLSRPFRSAIVCSVVPELKDAILEFFDSLGIEPRFVDNTIDLGLKIDYEPLDSLGTDRLVNAFAAVGQYGAPVIVCSLGTATTVDAISAKREFLGGIIAPGIDAMAEALHLKAPRLPHIDTGEPSQLLGRTTRDSIRSGIYYGYVAMVEGLIARFRDEAGNDAKVVATGGSANLVGPDCPSITTIDPDLLLKGLHLLARR